MDASAKRCAHYQESPVYAKKPKNISGSNVFLDMLDEGGCTAPDDNEPVRVEDPRVLRRYLVLRMTEEAGTKAAFTNSMQLALQEQAVLGSALLPMEVSAEGVPMTGDSLIRLLLNMSGIQTALACALVQRLPQAMEAHGSHEADSMPTRILGSLRWLDEIVDAHRITSTLLDMMPKCSKSVQQGILELLPELVLEEDCQAVISRLVQTTESNSTLLVPVLEAISNITAQDTGQAQVTDLVVQRFQSAELADLPALLRFLLQHVNSQNGDQVIQLLRSSMPPLAGKAVQVQGETIDVEESAMEAMRTGLQCSHLAADTVFSQIKALTEAEVHLGLDLWLLLLLASLSGKRCEAVHKLLKKKFAEGAADSTWLDKAVCGHQGALKSLFPSFLEVAGRLVQAGQAGCQAGGSHLYTLLFAAPTPTPPAAAHRQQEVLGGLQGHLGSGQAGEISTALAILLSLTGEHAGQLLQHAHFVTALLDCLDSFSQAQLHQVFEVVTKLVVASKSATTEVDANRQRLGKQLEALLRKQMQSEEVHSQRVGIIGTIKLAERLAASTSSDPRSKEAEELLGRSFSVRQRQPAMFALLCDELTQAVAGGRLSEPLREWLKTSATDQLESFLDDFMDNPPDVQCEGGDAIEGANWMNLNGSAGQVMLPLLRIVSSSDQDHRQSLAYLCAVTRLALTLEFQIMGSLDGLSAILGCPLHMPHLDRLHKPALLAASPHQHWLLCTSLLLAINWLRELLNAWAHHIQPHQCVGGAEVQQNLLVRLQNLCQLEALLAHTLQLLPHPPNLHTFSGCSQPAAPVKKAQKKSRSKKSKAVQSTEDSSGPADDQENIANNASPPAEAAADPDNTVQMLSRMAEVQGELRCLDPHVLTLLGQVQCAALPQAGLAPATLLMEEMHGKLVEAMTRARRPSFLNAAAAQDEPTGSHQTPQEIWGGLETILPALRNLLSSCNAVSSSGQDEFGGGQGVVAARVEGPSQEATPDLLLTDHPVAIAALAPAPAAARVMQRGLHCIQQLTASDWLKQPQHRGLLQAFIRAFRRQSDSPEQEPTSTAGAMQASQVIEGCLQACDTFKGLSKGPQGSLEHEVALLHIQANLVAIAQGFPGNAATRASLAEAKEGVSTAAEHILQQGSEPQPSQPADCASAQPADPLAMSGASWKGQQGVIGDLIHLWVSWSPQPCQTVLDLLEGALAQVPPQPLTGKKAQEPVHPYPGLSGSSLHVWYKALFQEVLQQWSCHGNMVVALHKTRQGPLQQEGADAALLQLQHCGRAFASLLALNKIHIKRIQMHSQALRCGSKVIHHCLRTLPFWEAWYGAHPNQVEPFSRALKNVQSGTRILYVICAEGKANKNITIANLVVGTKHVLEEFRVGVTAVMLAAKQHISQGNLKHKDLTGAEVSSQVPFTQVQIDEDVSDSEEQHVQEEAGGSDTE